MLFVSDVFFRRNILKVLLKCAFLVGQDPGGLVCACVAHGTVQSRLSARFAQNSEKGEKRLMVVSDSGQYPFQRGLVTAFSFSEI